MSKKRALPRPAHDSLPPDLLCEQILTDRKYAPSEKRCISQHKSVHHNEWTVKLWDAGRGEGRGDWKQVLMFQTISYFRTDPDNQKFKKKKSQCLRRAWTKSNIALGSFPENFIKTLITYQAFPFVERLFQRTQL